MDKKIENALRTKWINKCIEWLESNNEEALQTAAGAVYVPTLDDNGDDAWIELRAIVHGKACEEDGTDGYSLNKQYKDKISNSKKRKEKNEPSTDGS